VEKLKTRKYFLFQNYRYTGQRGVSVPLVDHVPPFNLKQVAFLFYNITTRSNASNLR
jgi:hypothetical protein